MALAPAIILSELCLSLRAAAFGLLSGLPLGFFGLFRPFDSIGLERAHVIGVGIVQSVLTIIICEQVQAHWPAKSGPMSWVAGVVGLALGWIVSFFIFVAPPGSMK